VRGLSKIAKMKTASSRARELRTKPTLAEQKMWALLRDRRLAEYKFRRQQPVGPYILDFYGEKLRLAVELDGSGHMQTAQKDHDLMRDRFIRSEGVRVLRFWNNDVMKQTDSVLQRIIDASSEGQD